MATDQNANWMKYLLVVMRKAPMHTSPEMKQYLTFPPPPDTHSADSNENDNLRAADSTHRPVTTPQPVPRAPLHSGDGSQNYSPASATWELLPNCSCSCILKQQATSSADIFCPLVFKEVGT